MEKYTSIIWIILCGFLMGCSMTGHMSRKQYHTTLAHSAVQDRQPKETETDVYRQGFIEVTRVDSSKAYILPSRKNEKGEDLMQLELEEVTITAKSRSLPERLGKVHIDFVITLPKELQGSCRSVVVTPVLHKAEEDVKLEELTIRGGVFSKVQQRNYWQYHTYQERFKPDSLKDRRAYDRFIYYPYSETTRLDSVIESKTNLRYYYTQEVPTDEAGGSLLVSLTGKVVALDRSSYELPVSDTLNYSISSMLNFVDTTTRYVTKIIEKYAVVRDRNYLTYPVNSSEIVDSLGNNRQELHRIEQLMDGILKQKEFYVDSILLTASASPEGTLRKNERLAEERAHSLRRYLTGVFPAMGLDTLITIRSIGEDWAELERLIALDEKLENRDGILSLLATRFGIHPDALEKEIKRKFPSDYKYLLEHIYPALRSVSFTYDLRRVNMVKDTIHTTIPDTIYARGIELLKGRNYTAALSILEGFYDRNTAICFLSIGEDGKAYQVLKQLSGSSTVEYLCAIAAARLGKPEEAMEHFEKAVRMNENMKFRGMLDPELSILLKERGYYEDD